MYSLMVKGKDILPKSENLGWTSDADTLGIELSFDSIINLPEGSIVKLFNDKKEIIRCVLVKKTEGKFSYSYTCFDYGFYLKNETIIQFDTNASNAISMLLNDFKIKNKITNIPTRIKKLYKDMSIADIIDDILGIAELDQGEKYIKEIQIETVVISKLTSQKITPDILIGKDFEVNSSIEELKNKIIVAGSDSDKSAVLAVVEDIESQKKFGLMQEVVTVDKGDVAKSRHIGANSLKEKNKISKDTSINLIALKNGELIKANRMIELNLGKKLKGWHRIKSASHSLSKGKHTITISLEW